MTDPGERDASEAATEDAARLLSPLSITESVLTREVLDRLRDINRQYLVALAFDAQRFGTTVSGVPALLAQLDDDTRVAVADCPFALFGARFHDGAFWAEQCHARSVHEPQLRLFGPSHPMRPDIAAFCDIALFYAWHLAQAHPGAARILLGMSESTVKVFKSLSLDRIQRLASEQPQLIGLRWSQKKNFWESLLRVAKSGSVQRVGDMRLLGVQMMASELATYASR